MVANEFSLAAYYGMNALKIAFAIVMGMAFILPIPRDVFFRIIGKNKNK